MELVSILSCDSNTYIDWNSSQTDWLWPFTMSMESLMDLQLRHYLKVIRYHWIKVCFDQKHMHLFISGFIFWKFLCVMQSYCFENCMSGKHFINPSTSFSNEKTASNQVALQKMSTSSVCIENDNQVFDSINVGLPWCPVAQTPAKSTTKWHSKPVEVSDQKESLYPS